MRAARHCSEGFFPGYYGDYGSAESRYESEPGGIRNDAGCLVGGRCFYCLHDPFGGGHFSQDIYKRFINPSVSDEKFVTVNRLTIFGVGLITLWFAFNAAGILKTMIAGLSMTTALTCVFLFTVFAPGLCRRSSAFYTTLVGLLGLVVWEFVPALHVLQHVIYFEWLICIVTFLIVAVVDKTPIKVPEYVEEEA